MRRGLAPVIGSGRVDRLVDAETKARATLASWIAPSERAAPGASAPEQEYPVAPNGYRIYPFDASRFAEPTLSRHEFLSGLHRVLEPRAYLEVGVADGRSLTLSTAKTIGVDPAFEVVSPLHSDLLLARQTSDEFFDSPQAKTHLAGTPLDLAFIDGMHWAEFAYRDFVNVEKLVGPLSVVVLDDMMPRSIHEAARDRYTDAWAGDVFKVVELLRVERPDLVVVPVNTFPTGVVLLISLDPSSAVLADRYDELLPVLTSADPQDVPDHVIERSHAVDGRDVIAWPGWDELRELRGRPRATVARKKLLASFAETFVR